MPPKLDIWNQRMLILMDHCIALNDVETKKEFLESIGMKPTALNQVKSGAQGFTHSQLYEAAKKYKINVNWFYGFDTNMIRADEKKTPIDMLRAAVVAVEIEVKSKNK